MIRVENTTRKQPWVQGGWVQRAASPGPRAGDLASSRCGDAARTLGWRVARRNHQEAGRGRHDGSRGGAGPRGRHGRIRPVLENVVDVALDLERSVVQSEKQKQAQWRDIASTGTLQPTQLAQYGARVCSQRVVDKVEPCNARLWDAGRGDGCGSQLGRCECGPAAVTQRRGTLKRCKTHRSRRARE